MAECDRLAGCAFFNYDESDPDVVTAKRGLERQYCRGEKRDSCVRLAVLREFGDVPRNMMPNGFPFPGTDDSEWNTMIIEFKRDLFIKRFQ